MSIRAATGPLYEMLAKRIGEEFSYIKIGRCSDLISGILQALHEFKSNHGVTVENYQIIIHSGISSREA